VVEKGFPRDLPTIASVHLQSPAPYCLLDHTPAYTALMTHRHRPDHNSILTLSPTAGDPNTWLEAFCDLWRAGEPGKGKIGSGLYSVRSSTVILSSRIIISFTLASYWAFNLSSLRG